MTAARKPALVSTIIGLAHALQHTVLRKRETEEQSRLLRLSAATRCRDIISGDRAGRGFASTYLHPLQDEHDPGPDTHGASAMSGRA